MTHKDSQEKPEHNKTEPVTNPCVTAVAGCINQCDGCQAGIPLVNGVHRMGREGGYPDFMGCTAHLYNCGGRDDS